MPNGQLSFLLQARGPALGFHILLHCNLGAQGWNSGVEFREVEFRELAARFRSTIRLRVASGQPLTLPESNAATCCFATDVVSGHQCRIRDARGTTLHIRVAQLVAMDHSQSSARHFGDLFDQLADQHLAERLEAPRLDLERVGPADNVVLVIGG